MSARKRAAEWPWKSPTSHNDPRFLDWGEHDSALAYLTIREGHQTGQQGGPLASMAINGRTRAAATVRCPRCHSCGRTRAPGEGGHQRSLEAIQSDVIRGRGNERTLFAGSPLLMNACSALWLTPSRTRAKCTRGSCWPDAKACANAAAAASKSAWLTFGVSVAIELGQTTPLHAQNTQNMPLRHEGATVLLASRPHQSAQLAVRCVWADLHVAFAFMSMLDRAAGPRPQPRGRRQFGSGRIPQWRRIGSC